MGGSFLLGVFEVGLTIRRLGTIGIWELFRPANFGGSVRMALLPHWAGGCGGCPGLGNWGIVSFVSTLGTEQA